MINIEQALTDYRDAVADHLQQVEQYLGGSCSNAALARRIRKASTELSKTAKEMRSLTVENHRK